MKLLISLVTGFIVSSCSPIKPVATDYFDPARSIVKIQAISQGGRQNLGSGVVIAPDKIATNCHIIRTAQRAFVIVPDGLYPVIAQAVLPEFDICILKTERLNVPVTDLADSDAIQVGDDIVLSGFPLALGRRTSQGKVAALYPYGGGQVIEINTGFNHGASGGGVFNKEGGLIGLMTFMGKENSAMHFYVIPSTWLEAALEQEFSPLRPVPERSFWEKGEFVKQFKK